MAVVQINKDGYKCGLYFHDPVQSIDVTDAEYEMLNKCKVYYNWKYSDGSWSMVCVYELDYLRERRARECFPFVNRGQLWYNTLDDTQVSELNDWYQAWLNVTETKVVPSKPEWLK